MANTLSAIAGAIPVVGSVVSSLFDNANQKDINYQNHDWQVEQYNRERRDALADWQTQTEYNSPKEQRKRLIEGGYNPALVYGTVGSNVAAPVSHTSVAPARAESSHVRDFGQAAAQGLSSYMALRKTEPEINLMERQSTNIAVDSALKGFQMGLISAETENKEKDTFIKDYQGALWDSESNLKRQELEQKSKLFGYQSAAAKLEVEKLSAEIPILKRRDAREALMTAVNSKEAAARILEIYARTANLTGPERERIRTETKRMESEFYDPARNDNSSFYINQTSHLVGSTLQAVGAGTAAGAASRLFKGTKSIGVPSSVRNYTFGENSNPYFKY